MPNRLPHHSSRRHLFDSQSAPCSPAKRGQHKYSDDEKQSEEYAEHAAVSAAPMPSRPESSAPAVASRNIADEFDVVLFFGDLNYRCAAFVGVWAVFNSFQYYNIGETVQHSVSQACVKMHVVASAQCILCLVFVALTQLHELNKSHIAMTRMDIQHNAQMQFNNLCRLARPPTRSVAALSSAPQTAIEELRKHDQLRCALQEDAEHALVAFCEGCAGDTAPAFKPTYKYAIGTEQYDAKRVPAWTDRILWRCNYAHTLAAGQPHDLPHHDAAGITPVQVLWYDAVHAAMLSDHQPVVAALDCKLKHSGRLAQDAVVDHASYFTVQRGRSRKQQWQGRAGVRPSMRRMQPSAVLPMATGPLQSNAAAVLSAQAGKDAM